MLCAPALICHALLFPQRRALIELAAVGEGRPRGRPGEHRGRSTLSGHIITFRHLDSNQDNGLQRTAGCRLPNAGLWLQPVGEIWGRLQPTTNSRIPARPGQRREVTLPPSTAEAQPSILRDRLGAST